MNKYFYLFLMFFVFTATTIHSEVRSPVVFALRSKAPVVVDGIFDEECWSRALKINHFLNIYDNSKPASPQTFFQIVYDSENLYFGITGEEPNISAVNREPFNRDSWPKGSSIEIFLDTNRDRTTYYQFVTNLGGGVFDSYNKDVKWDGNWKIASNVFQDRWTIEIAVPFSDFGMRAPEIGTIWGLDVCRNREGGLQYSSSWAPVGGNFHNPGKFNALIFGSVEDWLKMEIQDYRSLRNEYLAFLMAQKPPEERLKSMVERTSLLMERVRKTRISQKATIEKILPVYEMVEEIKVLCRDIEDEIKAIRAINSIKTED